MEEFVNGNSFFIELLIAEIFTIFQADAIVLTMFII